MIFLEKISNLKKKFHFFYINFVNDIYVINAPWTLKRSRNVQDFALIRAVLFNFGQA